MSRKNVILIISILGIVVVVGSLFYGAFFSSEDPSVSPEVVQERALPHHPNTRVSSKAKPGEDRTLLHPLADPAKREAYRNQPITSWEEWAKALIEIDLGFYVEKGFALTLDELTHHRDTVTQHWNSQALRYKKKNHPVPTTAIKLPYLEEPAFSRYYEGPQTTAAIMAEYDAPLTSYFPRAEEMEETYPREAFLQRLLDKGAVIKDGSDYAYWMKLRSELLYRKDRPDDWQSGGYGIPVTTDFAEYEEGFLERKVWENSIIQQVSESNPGRSVTVCFTASHPDVYLPVIGNMTYVHRDKSGGINAIGAVLTEEQRTNLLFKGIEPKNREIVYIDEDYNVLSEPPPVVTLQDLFARAPSHPKEVNGVQLTPENYESVVGHPAPVDWLRDYEADDMHATVPDADLEAMREAAREAAASEQAAAKAEFEKFQQGMRQLEEFASMSDAEIEKTLENQFRQKFLPQHPLEQLEHFTPERLEKALGTLFQHGFDDGFRRISRDNPALAEQLKQYFGQGQKPPAGKLPKGSVPLAPPAPPEAAPPESDTD